MAVAARHNRPGFTLMEVLLATIIGALVILVALFVFRALSISRQQQMLYSELTGRGRFVLRQISEDLRNCYRGPAGTVKIKGLTAHSGTSPADRLVFYRIGDPQPFTNNRITGDLFEIEYGLCPDTGNALWLARRCAPLLDTKNGNPRGRLVKLSDAITLLQFDYYDNNAWQRGWDHSYLPQIVRVTFRLADPVENVNLTFSQEISLEPFFQPPDKTP